MKSDFSQSSWIWSYLLLLLDGKMPQKNCFDSVPTVNSLFILWLGLTKLNMQCINKNLNLVYFFRKQIIIDFIFYQPLKNILKIQLYWVIKICFPYIIYNRWDKNLVNPRQYFVYNRLYLEVLVCSAANTATANKNRLKTKNWSSLKCFSQVNAPKTDFISVRHL